MKGRRVRALTMPRMHADRGKGEQRQKGEQPDDDKGPREEVLAALAARITSLKHQGGRLIRGSIFVIPGEKMSLIDNRSSSTPLRTASARGAA